MIRPSHKPSEADKASLSFRLKTLFLLLMLLVCAQSINGGLSILSFKSLHLDSINASYEVIGVEFQKYLERALRFGKPLDNFLGIEKRLQTIKDNNPDLENVAIALPNGQVIYSLKAEHIGAMLPIALQPDAFSDASEQAVADSPKRVELTDSHHLFFPIQARSKALAGTLELSFTKKMLSDKRNHIIISNLKILASTTLSAAILLFVGFQILFVRGRKPSKKVLYTLIFFTVGVAQLSYAALSIYEFKTSYMEITEKKIITVSQILQQDIEALLAKGIKIDALVKIEEGLRKTEEAIPEVSAIRILDNQKNALYTSGRETDAVAGSQTRTFSDFGTQDHYSLTFPIEYQQQPQGLLDIEISGLAINQKTNEIMLDSLTVVALSFLFLMELLSFMFITGMGRVLHSSVKNETESFLLIRPAIAIYIYAASLCYSFIPLYMAEIYEPMLNFSKDFVIGLPISIEMFCGGIALIPVGHWIDKRGWHQPFITGICLSMVGTIMSGLATGPVEFIFYRGLTGLGYGFSWMSAQGFILLNTDKKNRAQGISSVVAGIFSGIICGSVVGGMIAERIGYAQVFFVAAMIMLTALAFVLLFMRNYFAPPPKKELQEAPFGYKQFCEFIFDRNIFLIFTCSVIPYSVCMVGLLYYISPIYLKQLGTTQSNIGRVIMVFGLCMIYVAPQVSRFVDQFENKKLFISLGGVMGSIGMLIFYYFNGIWAVVFAIFVLGLSVSVSAASRNVLTIDQTISQKIGVSKVMGIYRTVDKIGQTLGPVILGLLLIEFEIRQAVGLIGVAYILMTALFVLGVRQNQQLEASAETGT